MNMIWVFTGPLVIVIHLLLSPVMAKLLSDFHSYQERPWILFAFRYVLFSDKHNSGTFLFCWEVLTSEFLPFMFWLLFTYSPNHCHSILFCFSILFISVASGNLSFSGRPLGLNLIRQTAVWLLLAIIILISSHW